MQNDNSSSDRRLQIGIIGIDGRGGSIACLAHQPDKNVQVVAGADIDPSCFGKFKQRYGDSTFVTKDYQELLNLDHLDAVVVATPDFCHEEHAIAALRKGKHVYLEKPMAITTEGCDRILEEAAKSSAKLYLGHNMRHFPVIQKMKQLISEGVIGEVKTAWCRHFIDYGGDAYFKDWHAERSKSTGLLLQKGAHDLDILHWLCGGYTARVVAMGDLMVYGNVKSRRGDGTPVVTPKWSNDNWPPMSQKGLNPIIDIEDVSMVLMQLDNGVMASYQQCHFTPDSIRNYTIIGTEGRLENIRDDGGENVIQLWNKRSGMRVTGDVQYSVPLESGSHYGADKRIVQEFIDYLRDDIEITTSAIAARHSVATGISATESLRSGGIPVKVPKVREDILRKLQPEHSTLPDATVVL